MAPRHRITGGILLAAGVGASLIGLIVNMFGSTWGSVILYLIGAALIFWASIKIVRQLLLGIICMIVAIVGFFIVGFIFGIIFLLLGIVMSILGVLQAPRIIAKRRGRKRRPIR